MWRKDPESLMDCVPCEAVGALKAVSCLRAWLSDSHTSEEKQGPEQDCPDVTASECVPEGQPPAGLQERADCAHSVVHSFCVPSMEGVWTAAVTLPPI